MLKKRSVTMLLRDLLQNSRFRHVVVFIVFSQSKRLFCHFLSKFQTEVPSDGFRISPRRNGHFHNEKGGHGHFA